MHGVRWYARSDGKRTISSFGETWLHLLLSPVVVSTFLAILALVSLPLSRLSSCLSLFSMQVKIEAIARQYITGSMWRDYSKGSREFCGISMPDGIIFSLLLLLLLLLELLPLLLLIELLLLQ